MKQVGIFIRGLAGGGCRSREFVILYKYENQKFAGRTRAWPCRGAVQRPREGRQTSDAHGNGGSQ